MSTRTRSASKEEYNAYQREYRSKNKERIALIKKRSVEKNGNKWNERNKLALHTHAIVRQAIKKGLLQRLPCEECGEEKSHGHHDNYFRPLDIKWLCVFHHRARHNFLKESGEGIEGLY